MSFVAPLCFYCWLFVRIFRFGLLRLGVGFLFGVKTFVRCVVGLLRGRVKINVGIGRNVY